MNLHKRLRDELGLTKERNPWQPYMGPAGGQGWVNALTGEVRYQEARPGAQEGTHDEEDLEQIPEYGERIPGELTVEEPQLEDYLEPGMEISGDVAGTAYRGEVVETDEQGARIEITESPADSVGDEAVLMWDEIEEHPAQLPPPMGWEHGWQARSNAAEEYEEGQTIEVYDLETGQYEQAEVIDTLSPDYIQAVTEEDEEYELFLDDPGGDGALVTAMEDLDAHPSGLEDYDLVEGSADLEHGDMLSVQTESEQYADRLGVEPGEIAEVEVDEVTDAGNVEGYSLENSERIPIPIDNDAVDVYAEPPELVEPEWIPGLDIEDPEAAEWDLTDGEYVAIDHPTFGEVEGEAEIIEDPHGFEWLTVHPDFDPVDPADAQPGDVIFHPGEDAVAEVRERPDWAIGDASLWLEPPDGGGGALGVEPEDVEPIAPEHVDGDDISLTTNPEHPLYVGEYLQATTDPWTQISSSSEAWQTAESLKTGDWVYYDGQASQIVASEMTGDGPVIDLDTGDTLSGQDELEWIQGVIENEWADPPAGYDWQSPPPEFNDGDMVHYYDPETGGMEAGRVDGQASWGDGEIDLYGDQTIPVERIDGYADTGQPELPGNLTASDVDVHDYIEYATYNHADEVVTGEGVVMNIAGYSGDLTVVDPDTGEEFVVEDDPDQTSIIDVGSYDTPSYDHIDSPEEFADELASKFHIDGHGPIEKHRLRLELQGYFSEYAVTDFYDSLVGPNYSGGWKYDSGGHDAGRYDQAMARAAGSNRPTRDGPDPSSEMVELAETIIDLSQRRFEANPPGILYRGLSEPGGAGVLAAYLEDPFGSDEYEVPMLATNNFTEQQYTAQNLGDSPVVVYMDPSQIDSEQVLNFHDDFFRHENDAEDEIALKGDDFRVPRDQIYLMEDDSKTLENPPHEWSQEVASAFKDTVDRYGERLLHDHNPNAMPTHDQLANMVRIERALNEIHGLSTAGIQAFEAAHRELADMDIRVDEIDYPELDEMLGTVSEADAQETVTLDPPAEAYADHIGEEVYYDQGYGSEGTATIVEVDDMGRIVIEDEYGDTTAATPGIIEEGPVDGYDIPVEDLPVGTDVEFSHEGPDESSVGDSEILEIMDDGQFLVEAETWEGTEERTIPPSAVTNVWSLPDDVDPADLAIASPSDQATPGDEVNLSNDLPESHPDSIDETGYVTEIIEQDGEDLIVVEDEFGTVINEYSPDEFDELATLNLPEPPGEYEILDEVRYETEGMAGPQTARIEDVLDSGTVILSDGTHIPEANVDDVLGEVIEDDDDDVPETPPFNVGDVVDTPEYGSPVTVTEVGESSVTVEDAGGYEWEHEAGDHNWEDIVTGEVTEPAEGTDDTGLPDYAETDIVHGSPNWDDFEVGDFVEHEGEIYEVAVAPDTPGDEVTIVGDDLADEYNVAAHEIDAIVEAEGADDAPDGLGPGDVEPGDMIEVDGWDDPVEVDGLYEDPEYGVTGVEAAGDVLDFGEIEVVTDDGSSILDDITAEVEGALPDDDGTDWDDASSYEVGQTVEWGGAGDTGEVVGISDDGNLVDVDTGEMGVMPLDPETDVAPVEDADDEGDVTPWYSPGEVHEQGVGMGELFETTISGEGDVTVEVVDTPVDPAYPVEVEAIDTGDRYLIWTDGEVESA